MQNHPRSRWGLMYRYNPNTKRLQFWDRYNDRSRWINSQSFSGTFENARVARELIVSRGYKVVTYASTFCEPETYASGA